jgi:hypothetical protein
VSATVEPSTGLTPGQTVTVHGANLRTDQETWVMQCRAGGAPRACDLDHAIRFVADAGGTFTRTFPVVGTFTSPLGDAVDCLSAPGACSIDVSLGFSFVGDRHAAVAISFVTPPPTTVPPTTLPELAFTGHRASATLVGLGLLLAGGAALALGRRRVSRTRTTPTA